MTTPFMQLWDRPLDGPITLYIGATVAEKCTYSLNCLNYLNDRWITRRHGGCHFFYFEPSLISFTSRLDVLRAFLKPVATTSLESFGWDWPIFAKLRLFLFKPLLARSDKELHRSGNLSESSVKRGRDCKSINLMYGWPQVSPYRLRKQHSGVRGTDPSPAIRLSRWGEI